MIYLFVLQEEDCNWGPRRLKCIIDANSFTCASNTFNGSFGSIGSTSSFGFPRRVDEGRPLDTGLELFVFDTVLPTIFCFIGGEDEWYCLISLLETGVSLVANETDKIGEPSSLTSCSIRICVLFVTDPELEKVVGMFTGILFSIKSFVIKSLFPSINRVGSPSDSTRVTTGVISFDIEMEDAELDLFLYLSTKSAAFFVASSLRIAAGPNTGWLTPDVVFVGSINCIVFWNPCLPDGLVFAEIGAVPGRLDIFWWFNRDPLDCGDTLPPPPPPPLGDVAALDVLVVV